MRSGHHDERRGGDQDLQDLVGLFEVAHLRPQALDL
jgi:hypothetical protein